MALGYAGPFRRGAAFLLDLIPVAGMGFLLVVNPGGGPLPVAWLPGLVYWTAFAASPWQASPGQRIFGLKLMEYQGRRVLRWRALSRAFLKMLMVALVFQWPSIGAAIALLTLGHMALQKRHRTWIDLLCGTAVIELPKDVRR